MQQSELQQIVSSNYNARKYKLILNPCSETQLKKARSHVSKLHRKSYLNHFACYNKVLVAPAF